MQLSNYIDHTLLKAFASENEIIKLCNEAIEHRFYAVCVNVCWVKICYSILSDKNIKIASVIGFPLGANDTETKLLETQNAIKNGADEIDMVINIGWLKSGKFSEVENEIKA
jgi:deoxyribose-phosphate aldolase